MISNDTNIVKYNSAYGEIELSPQTVKQFLARGNAAVTEQDIKMFIELCKYQKLNPFTNEVHLIGSVDKSSTHPQIAIQTPNMHSCQK